MGKFVPRALALAGAAWCLGVSVWIWITPIRGEGIGSSAYTNADGVVQTTAYRFTTTTSFADRSLLGPMPLLIPVLLAALGAWAVWRGRVLPAAIATGILLVFTILGGFSIGFAYIPAVAALGWGVVAGLDSTGS